MDDGLGLGLGSLLGGGYGVHMLGCREINVTSEARLL